MSQVLGPCPPPLPPNLFGGDLVQTWRPGVADSQVSRSETTHRPYHIKSCSLAFGLTLSPPLISEISLLFSLKKGRNGFLVGNQKKYYSKYSISPKKPRQSTRLERTKTDRTHPQNSHKILFPANTKPTTSCTTPIRGENGGTEKDLAADRGSQLGESTLEKGSVSTPTSRKRSKKQLNQVF